MVLVPLAVVAGATAQVRLSAPSPTPSSLVLQASDFRAGGATGSQSSHTKSGETVFMRTFKPGARLSSTPLLMVESIAMVEPDADTAAVAYSELAPARREALRAGSRSPGRSATSSSGGSRRGHAGS